jgi:hypothetical protein
LTGSAALVLEYIRQCDCLFRALKASVYHTSFFLRSSPCSEHYGLNHALVRGVLHFSSTIEGRAGIIHMVVLHQFHCDFSLNPGESGISKFPV